MALQIPDAYYPHPVPGVATRGNLLALGDLSNGTDTSSTYFTRHVVTQSHFDTQIEFVNFHNADAAHGPDEDGPNAITVKASIQDSSGNLIPLFFGGTRSVTIQPGGRVRSDIIGRPFTRAEIFFMRTYVSVASAGMKWPLGAALFNSNGGEGYTAGSDLSDSTTTVTTHSGYGYSPTRFLGRPSGAQVAPMVWAVIGDSVAAGAGDARDSAGMFTYAFGEIDSSGGTSSITGAGSSSKPADFLWQRLAQPGDAPGFWGSGVDFSRRKRPLLEGCTHVICELGINGLGASTAYHLNNLWTNLAARGLKVYATTLPPRTTSTDSWATASNQTPISAETTRVAYNDWVRTTPAPLSGYIDVADAVEVNSSGVLTRNGGRWYATGSANGASTDGIHPAAVNHLRAAAPIRALVSGLTPRAV